MCIENISFKIVGVIGFIYAKSAPFKRKSDKATPWLSPVIPKYINKEIKINK